MKHKICTALWIFLCIPLFGALPDYLFTYSVGTWQQLSSGTLLGDAATDELNFIHPDYPGGLTGTQSIGLPIGFDFSFEGQVYDRFGINANGWIGLGKSVYGNHAIDLRTTLSSSPLDYSNSNHNAEDRLARIAGFSRNLAAQTGASLSYASIGTAPERILVVQWLHYRRAGVTGDSFNFQIRLHESSSQVSVVFGQMQSAGLTGGQVGMRAMPAAAATNYANRTTANAWHSSQAGTMALLQASLSPSNFPELGTCFSWQDQSAIPPIAEFSALPLSGYRPLNVQFTDASQATEQPISSWHWNFGDGSSSELSNPSHTYQTAGSYSVSLTVTDSQGNAHSQNKANYISVYEPSLGGQAELYMQGFDAHISWEPITTDEHGASLQPSYYYLYFNGSADPWGEYYFLAPIAYPATNFVHQGVGRGASHMFYRVKAVQ